MAFTEEDYNKIWASNSPLPEYTFSDDDYLEGWNFVGELPPSRTMWDAFKKDTDLKMKDLYGANKEWCERAETASANAENSAELAEDWATKTDGTVDGSEYSAKYYANEANASATSASASATNASNSASSASTTANALINFLETKETLTAPAVDPTLSISGAAADAKVTGDGISYISNEVLDEDTDAWFNGTVIDNQYTTSTFSGFATSWVTTEDTYLKSLTFSVKSRAESNISIIKIRIESGSFVFERSYNVDIDTNFTDVTLPVNVIVPAGTVWVAVASNEISQYKFGNERGHTYRYWTSGNISDLSGLKDTGSVIYRLAIYANCFKELKSIPNGSISQEKLSFAEWTVPENLFDYTSDDMCKRGYWYYSTTIGSTVVAGANPNTVGYVAIKVPIYDSEKVTLGIYPNVLDKQVYWYGFVDKDMKLISYNTGWVSVPLTATVPAGAVYFLASYLLSVENFDRYLPTVMVVDGETIDHYSSYFKPYYNLVDCKAEGDTPQSVAKLQTILGEDENTVKLCVPSSYDLVVGDTFQLFYKGIVNATNPEMYYVSVDCSKGSVYERYFEITPTTAENLTMTIKLYGINHNLLDSTAVILKIHAKATSPGSVKNILCVGDSLTTGGTWVVELNRRLTGSGGTPAGDGLTNINFIGTRVASGVHYEGYGGWTLASYNNASVDSNVRIITCTHDKTEAEDQHSIYKDANNELWKLETISAGQIKIIAVSGEGNNFPDSGTLTWVSGGVHHSNIVYTAQEMAPGNPFWDSDNEQVDFEKYALNLGVSSIDYVYVLIGWNSASWTEAQYKTEAQTFIDNVHASFPNAKIVFVGLEIPARDGLGVNYGASGIYSKYYELMQYVFNLDNWYADIAGTNSNVYSENLAGQFDTEYNMPTSTRQVNTRNPLTETYQSNGVHPATYGYYQIADAVYRDITARI